MSAELFVAAFLGCFLAVAAYDVVLWQIRARFSAAGKAQAAAARGTVVCDCGGAEILDASIADGKPTREYLYSKGWKLVDGSISCPRCVRAFEEKS